jgi:hypothetical protein
MTILDDIIPDKVVAILATYGKDTTFYVDTDPVYSPATGSVTSSGTTAYVIKASPPYPYKRQYINEDTIQEGDVQVLIAPQTAWAPTNGQKFVISGQAFRAVSVEPIYSGDDVAAYLVQGRQ